MKNVNLAKLNRIDIHPSSTSQKYYYSHNRTTIDSFVRVVEGHIYFIDKTRVVVLEKYFLLMLCVTISIYILCVQAVVIERSGHVSVYLSIYVSIYLSIYL